MDLFICKYCKSTRKNANSLKGHERLCKENPDRSYTPFQNPEVQANKKKSNQFIKARELGEEVPPNGNKGKPGKGTPHTEESRKNLSRIAKQRGYGGVRQSNRIQYNGKCLGSSYELELVRDLEINGIKWDTCGKFDYTDPCGKQRTYTPDIYLPDYDVYLDPKNDFLIHNVNPVLGFKDTEKIQIVENTHNIKVFVLSKGQLRWEHVQKLIHEFSSIS